MTREARRALGKLSRKILIIVIIAATVGIFVIPINPVIGKLLKLATIGCIVAAWTGLVMLVWRRRPMRIVVLVVTALAALILSVPGNAIERESLRADYVQRMSSLERTKYMWGGESALGIDCSGLPRRALRDSLLAYGIKHVSGRAFRAYLEQWWFDASARELGRGYRRYTTDLGVSGTIESMDYEQLSPGDIAVTHDGIHMLAYVGEGKWIQADPEVGHVVTLDGRKDKNSWFTAPVSMHRWRLLADQ